LILKIKNKNIKGINDSYFYMQNIFVLNVNI